MESSIPLLADVIPIGGTWLYEDQLTDEAGIPLSGAWEGACQLRDGYGGALVASPVVVIDTSGFVSISLTSVVTETLTAAFGVVGDLEVWETATPTVKYRALEITVRIQPEVTV